MAKTIRTKVYQFSELSEAAKRKAINDFSDVNVDYNYWYSQIYEGVAEDLQKLGYYNVEISFSGFYSQGDGASFTGSLDVNEWIKVNTAGKYKRIKDICFSCVIKRDRWNNYVHWNTTSVYLEGDTSHKNCPNIDNLINELEADILAQHQELNKDIYKRLENDYKYLTSEAAIIETIEANEYYFTKEGLFYRG